MLVRGHDVKVGQASNQVIVVGQKDTGRPDRVDRSLARHPAGRQTVHESRPVSRTSTNLASQPQASHKKDLQTVQLASDCGVGPVVIVFVESGREGVAAC